MRPLTTILTATYNKPRLLREAGESILAQTSGDWRWWVVLDGADEETTAVAHDLARQDSRIVLFTETVEARFDKYRPAALANKYIPLVSTPYFSLHADDDLKEPGFLEALVDALAAHPEYQVAYGFCRTYRQRGKDWILERILPADPSWRFGPNSDLSPDYRLNEGQIVQTKASWDRLGWRFPTDFREASHVDGVYLDQLARRFDFLFVNVAANRVRHTYLSENNRPPAAPKVAPAPPRPPAPAETAPAGHVRHGVDAGYMWGYVGLFLEGWFAAAHSSIKQVWLKDERGVEAAVPFRWRRTERQDVSESMKRVLPEGHTATGYLLMIDSPGVTRPRTLRFELEDGSRWSVDLSRLAFDRLPEPRCLELLHLFGKSADLRAADGAGDARRNGREAEPARSAGA